MVPKMDMGGEEAKEDDKKADDGDKAADAEGDKK